MRSIRFALPLLAVLLLCAFPAQAQTSRLYFAGYLGLNMSTEDDFSESTSATQGDIELQNSFMMAGALGLRLTPQWRIEGELSRRSANMDRIDFNAGGTFELGGELETWLYMLNVFYDVDWEWKNFQPFIMAGIGIASHDAQVIDKSARVPSATDDSMGFAWAMGGGVKYRVNPDLAFTTNYRYIGTSDLEVDTFDFEYSAHEFTLGLEYDLPMDWLH